MEQDRASSRGLSAVFAPIRTVGLAEEVTRRIEQALETGLLRGGQRLPREVELAAALGVSPVTAREALSILRERGLITTVRGRNGGSFVVDGYLPSTVLAMENLQTLTRLQINDLGLHYEAIASACAGIAARRADESDLQHLRQYLRPQEDTLLSWRLMDSEFMLEVGAIARSARLARELVRLQADLGTLTVLPYTDDAFRKSSVEHRNKVAEAIGGGNVLVAQNATRDLIHTMVSWLLRRRARELPMTEG
ncbi:DNA-binding FadR family transcriptional regulator [Arthrobacter sp. CAN_A2]|uniref:FadR/GntR family transcriptional regulator n=1 Tax=Arthrobacter sp. CAN_A2 TaxID=2787718 RepID=UPI0018F00CAB